MMMMVIVAARIHQSVSLWTIVLRSIKLFILMGDRWDCLIVMLENYFSVIGNFKYHIKSYDN